MCYYSCFQQNKVKLMWLIELTAVLFLRQNVGQRKSFQVELILILKAFQEVDMHFMQYYIPLRFCIVTRKWYMSIKFALVFMKVNQCTPNMHHISSLNVHCLYKFKESTYEIVCIVLINIIIALATEVNTWYVNICRSR